MPNLDEIKARREKINGASWKAVEGNSNDIRSSVFAGNDLLATLSPWKRHEYADFIANTPTDIDWLIAEVERLLTEVKALKAEKESMAEEYSQRLSHAIDDYYSAWANQQVEMEQLKKQLTQAEAERDALIYFLNDARREEQARVKGGDYSDMCPNAVLMTPNGDLDWLKYAKQQTEDVKDSTTKQGA